MRALNFHGLNLPANFAKLMSGGNDFIVLNNLAGAYDQLLAAEKICAAFVASVCDRQRGIGGDGVIFGSRTDKPDALAVRFFDSDGGEARFCGNGSACLTKLALDDRWLDASEIILHTRAGIARGEICGDSRYVVFVPPPVDFERELTLTANGKNFSADYLLVGVPHLVVPVADIEKIKLKSDGAALRHHPKFAALGGVNVNFVEIIAAGEIKMRTFEVGVEDETLSCGSGSIAAAILTCLRNDWCQKFRRGVATVHVQARSGEKLAIRFNLAAADRVTFASLETSAFRVCDGEIAPEFLLA